MSRATILQTSESGQNIRIESRISTILIVEDHIVIAADLADAVQRSGGQVLGPVSRLSEALAVIATAPCDAAASWPP
jgi:hypothetical protein